VAVRSGGTKDNKDMDLKNSESEYFNMTGLPTAEILSVESHGFVAKLNSKTQAPTRNSSLKKGRSDQRSLLPTRNTSADLRGVAANDKPKGPGSGDLQNAASAKAGLREAEEELYKIGSKKSSSANSRDAQMVPLSLVD